MSDDAFLKQAKEDAAIVKGFPESTKERVNRETDWVGYRMRGYEFPAQKVAASSS